MKFSIEALRVNSKLSQEEVGKYLGISKIAYGRKERGDVEFTFAEVQQLTLIFNVPIEMIAHP